ncbi:hypothetical protein [Candidatus Nanohalococcus occultus]|uniref:hypothetical protein n=1 Tax=Candidatus Nanohalococcus occultus TaxID=2978047 RepID=UPI0039DFB50F
MKKTLVLATLVLAFMAFGAAQTADSVEDARTVYNNQTDQVPDFLASIVGGERINVEINESGDITTIGVVMDGIKAEKVQLGGVENETINGYVERQTLDDIASSNDPLQRTVTAIKEDEITYSATSTSGKLKLGVIDLLKDLVGALF